MSRSTPCVEGCCGPMLMVMVSSRLVASICTLDSVSSVRCSSSCMGLIFLVWLIEIFKKIFQLGDVFFFVFQEGAHQVIEGEHAARLVLRCALPRVGGQAAQLPDHLAPVALERHQRLVHRRFGVTSDLGPGS